MSETNKHILGVIRTLVCDLFGADAAMITLDTSRDDVPGWDSLQHVNLIIDIERHFQVHLPEDRVSSIQTVGDVVDTVFAALTTER
jgi:acyl carrier protein